MEHIVQFAIGIDDDAIRKRVVESAYNDVVKQLVEEAKTDVKLNNRSYYYRESWSNIIERALQHYFDSNRDLIFNLAAEKLANSYKRTKYFKEKMNAAMDDMADE
jgi:hypothetical protein